MHVLKKIKKIKKSVCNVDISYPSSVPMFPIQPHFSLSNLSLSLKYEKNFKETWRLLNRIDDLPEELHILSVCNISLKGKYLLPYNFQFIFIFFIWSFLLVQFTHKSICDFFKIIKVEFFYGILLGYGTHYVYNNLF